MKTLAKLLVFVILLSLLAAWYYKRQTGTMTMNHDISVGALTGLFAGILGFLLSFVGMAGASGLANQIDQYLRDNNRGSISALMITGVWIEGQYLATQVALSHPDRVLRDRIGEQKIILGDLLMLLRPYRESSAEYTALYEMMEGISNAYRDVRITYRLGEPETAEQDGRLVMIQHEESIVEMSDEQLAQIAEVSKDVRNKLIYGK